MAAPGRPPTATRARILLAARAHCEAVGLRALTMEDVARRAGIGRATLYRQFSSKRALVQAVVAAETEAFFAALDAAVADCGSEAERLTEGFAFAVDYVRRLRLLERLRRSEPEALLPALIGDGRLIEQATAAVAARTHGAPDDAHGRVCAELLVRLVLSLALTPGSSLGVDTRAGALALARAHLVPMAAQRRPTTLAGA